MKRCDLARGQTRRQNGSWKVSSLLYLAQQDLEPLLVGVDAHFEAVPLGESGGTRGVSEFLGRPIEDR